MRDSSKRRPRRNGRNEKRSEKTFALFVSSWLIFITFDRNAIEIIAKQLQHITPAALSNAKPSKRMMQKQ
jgi:hypothetical protein